jgi:hypothetical protein
MGRDDRVSAEHVPSCPGNLRLCLDWTERRFHFAGGLPSAILQYLLETRPLERADQRSLIVTRLGKAWFDEIGGGHERLVYG